MFPVQGTARAYIESRRWVDVVYCLHCDGDKITARKGKQLGYCRCRNCKEGFTGRTGRSFKWSHAQLRKQIYEMHPVATAGKGISSMQLTKAVGNTQRTAWFILNRLRKACGIDFNQLTGIIEMDEAYIDGKEANKHAKKELKAGGKKVSEISGIGAREHDGRMIAKPMETAERETVARFAAATVEDSSAVYADRSTIYGKLSFPHESVNHSEGEFVGDGIHTNVRKVVWAVFKCLVNWTWCHVSVKHLHGYVNEATLRLNDGRRQHHALDRLESLALSAFKHRFTYRELAS